MAAKKKEVVLQINITSQELWEEVLCLKGLIVVDVFQAWCGPCKPVVNLFKKIRNEVGSNLLHFAVAEVDSIDALEKYRGQCEPVFLFYTGGELVDVVRGANAPLLKKTILKYLAGERKDLRGRESVVVPDRAFSREQGSTAPLQEEQREGLTAGIQLLLGHQRGHSTTWAHEESHPETQTRAQHSLGVWHCETGGGF
ncbi:PREDICTED: thioredoxin domain-containing protein 6 isoform X1 [Ficedula albicollis]|uniref:thioredoxin domain-containing protein 6 isoform X1 n=1 Tax=Ficedula albicollis TaxID=59894 RepID=UPI0007AD7F2C|nr:PREDICTED: thioredoxin domain-containing protein 6 isoform X1 [Ficedula albicollis]